MVAAADRCVADAPNRAVAMLVDAAAWKVLADEVEEADGLVRRATDLAPRVGSHAELLVGALRSAVGAAEGRPADDLAERTWVSLLVGQPDGFSWSPEVALAIGTGLVRRQLGRQAERWAEWVGRCAERNGDHALAAVPWLLRADVHLADGQVAEAREAIEAGVAIAEDRCGPAVVAWAWAFAVRVYAVAGDRRAGFACSANLFAVTEALGRSGRLRAMPALALLELQEDRVGPALAWIHAVEDEVGQLGPAVDRIEAAGSQPVPAMVVDVGLPAMVARQLAGQGDGVARPPGDANADPDHLPVVRSLLGLSAGAHLVAEGHLNEARSCLTEVRRWADRVGAHGIGRLARRELTALGPADATDATATGATERPDAGEAANRDGGLTVGSGGSTAGSPVVSAAGAPGASTTGDRPSSGGSPEVDDWEVRLLGGFEIRCGGRPASLPPSLAAQAVKIVAVSGRLSVDELVEQLWEDAPPGVGSRRLRNVLWRVRSACGELLEREGNVIRLARGASTDLDRFRRLAEEAVAGAREEGSLGAAREAVELYGGELLPDDRYADWAATPRESAVRLYVGTLQLLVEVATEGDRPVEAVDLLDRLAVADPYDECHLVRLAEVHLQLGNRGRALEALGRAERTLADLGVSAPPMVLRLREALGGR